MCISGFSFRFVFLRFQSSVFCLLLEFEAEFPSPESSRVCVLLECRASVSLLLNQLVCVCSLFPAFLLFVISPDFVAGFVFLCLNPAYCCSVLSRVTSLVD